VKLGSYTVNKGTYSERHLSIYQGLKIELTQAQHRFGINKSYISNAYLADFRRLWQL